MLSIGKSLVVSIPYKDFLSYGVIFKKLKNVIFLESAKFNSDVGRYSYIAVDPFATLIYKNDQIYFNEIPCAEKNIFALLREKLALFSMEVNPELPPFQGGVAGFFSYDLARDLEKLPNHAQDDMHYPRLALGFYDLVIAFDHSQQKVWIISSGLPEKEDKKRQIRASSRLSWCLQLIQENGGRSVKHNPLFSIQNIQSNFTKKSYLRAVEKCRQHILNGDVFEVNLSQRFHCELPAHITAFDLYQQIREVNPAPFTAYIDLDNMAIVSSSPERFLKLQKSQVETRPIKGTIKRSKNRKKDLCLAKQLEMSAKDRAENTMIVDLMRNDLSRVCLPHTVIVSSYCGIESYETVHHLVSVIEGKLQPQYDAVDLLQAAFPAGSITGAPKIKAMEIIDELEPTRRGPYCGSAGYIGFDGNMDTSILIRTFVVKDNKITFQAGGAIVLDSNPVLEYEETIIKSAALKQALTEIISTDEVVNA